MKRGVIVSLFIILFFCFLYFQFHKETNNVLNTPGYIIAKEKEKDTFVIKFRAYDNFNNIIEKKVMIKSELWDCIEQNKLYLLTLKWKDKAPPILYDAQEIKDLYLQRLMQ